jgi:hypothetical protein
MYCLVACNKDDDDFRNLFWTSKIEECVEIGLSLVPCLRRDILKDENGEPYDWLEILEDDELRVGVISKDGIVENLM